MKSTSLAPAVAAVCAGLFAGPARASLSFTPLGTGSRANAVSADGSTVVGRIGGRATRWSGGVAHDLNTFGSGQFSTATAVSSDGSVIVGNAYNNDMFAPNTVAFRWTASSVSSYGATGGSYEGWGAMGVSGDGAVVVGNTGFGLAATAFGAPFGPPVTFGRSAARGISASGSVIAGNSRSLANDHDEAFGWTSAGGVQLLGALAGGVNSGATAVSGDGTWIVGWSESAPGRQAFRRSTGSAMIGLGDLDGGAFGSEALAANTDGSVIVGSASDASGVVAARWTPSGWVSVSQLLAGGGVDLTGWTLTAATGVSADGLTFVGNGIDPSGHSEGWIATIPAPGVPALLIAGAGLGLRRKRHAG